MSMFRLFLILNAWRLALAAGAIVAYVALCVAVYLVASGGGIIAP